MRLQGNDGLLGRRSRAERIRARRGILLQDVAITKRTQLLYFSSVSRILKLIEHATSETHLDDMLSQWIQLRWETGTPLYKISATLCGLHFYLPWTKKRLPQCWKLHSVWRRIEIPARAPPLPEKFLFSIANFAVHRDDYVFAALLVLGFEALLRTGELLQVKPTDLLLSDTQGLVRLPKTKTSQRKNAVEVVTFSNPWVLCLLQSVVDWKEGQGLRAAPLWDASPQAFRERFRAYMKYFKLSHCSFRPYSLRRGGATALFLRSGSYDLALEKGRWQSTKVAKVYIQEGLSHLPHLALPQATQYALFAWNPL